TLWGESLIFRLPGARPTGPAKTAEGEGTL
ncbi:unnamed protein product, partial [marine sediment metagenome]